MPLFGFALIAVQTVIFRYKALGKLASTYAARRLTTHVARNVVLHIAVAAQIVYRR